MAKLTISVKDETGFDSTFEATYPAALEGKLIDSIAELYGYPAKVHVPGPLGGALVDNPQTKEQFVAEKIISPVFDALANAELHKRVRAFEDLVRSEAPAKPVISKKAK
jgi:hypothetical protein